MRTHTLPMGVLMADEQRRELGILSENTTRETAIVRESRVSHPLYVSFIADSHTLGEIMKWAQNMEAAGEEAVPVFIRDRDGKIAGLRLAGRIR